eukprot:4965146-Prymnesium_polylepis.1
MTEELHLVVDGTLLGAKRRKPERAPALHVHICAVNRCEADCGATRAAGRLKLSSLKCRRHPQPAFCLLACAPGSQCGADLALGCWVDRLDLKGGESRRIAQRSHDLACARQSIKHLRRLAL